MRWIWRSCVSSRGARPCHETGASKVLYTLPAPIEKPRGSSSAGGRLTKRVRKASLALAKQGGRTCSRATGGADAQLSPRSCSARSNAPFPPRRRAASPICASGAGPRAPAPVPKDLEADVARTFGVPVDLVRRRRLRALRRRQASGLRGRRQPELRQGEHAPVAAWARAFCRANPDADNHPNGRDRP